MKWSKPTVRTVEIYSSPFVLVFACDMIPTGEKPLLTFRIKQAKDGWESHVIIDGVWHTLKDAPSRRRDEAMRYCYSWACDYFEGDEE